MPKRPKRPDTRPGHGPASPHDPALAEARVNAAKTDPRRSPLMRRQADQRRALKALEKLTFWQLDLWRWRQIAEWTPPSHAQTRARAVHHAEVAERRMRGYREVIWRALGYDPAAEPEAPRSHWDKGAMQDPS